MFNHIAVMGRLARDPELRRTNSGTAVTSFSLACERDIADKQSGTKAVDFIDCVACGGTAEIADRYLSKGDMAAVSGRLQIRHSTPTKLDRSAEPLKSRLIPCISSASKKTAHRAAKSQTQGMQRNRQRIS